MKKWIGIFCLWLAALSVGCSLRANHVVGGDMTYTFLAYNADSTQVTYLISMYLYRDEFARDAAPFDDPAEIGIYYRPLGGDWDHLDELRERIDQEGDVVKVDEPCRTEPTNVGVETALYEFEITLDVAPGEYMISYQRCCRNTGIVNLVNSDDVGSEFDVVITPTAQLNSNSSPSFNSDPPIFLCAGFPFEVDLSATDDDGDILRYTLCSAFTAGGPGGFRCNSPRPPTDRCLPPFDLVPYSPGYTAESPMGFDAQGSPNTVLNPNTGILSGLVDLRAAYVFTICVEEYRNGELLSTIRRDYQFNTLTCEKEVVAELVADGTEFRGDPNSTFVVEADIVKVCGDSTVVLSAIDEKNSIGNYEWVMSDDEGQVLLDSSGANLSIITEEFSELGEYYGYLIVKNLDDCVDTAFITLQRFPDMTTLFEYNVTDSCYIGTVNFLDFSETESATVSSWEWDFNGEGTSSEQNPSFIFNGRGQKTVTLKSGDNNACIDSLEVVIDYNPPHDRVLEETIPPQFRCFGDSIFFENRFIKESGIYYDTIQFATTGCDSVYRFLDLRVGAEPMTVITEEIICPGEFVDFFGETYESTGEYISTESSSLTGCDSVYNILNLTIEESPIINLLSNFENAPANIDFEIPNSITGDYAFVTWTPEEGLSCSDCPAPTVNSAIDTTYTITVETELGCRTSDAITLDFVITPENYYLPSIMSTQTGNDYNSVFFLQTLEGAEMNVDYDLYIYDRWGGLMYEAEGIPVNDRSEGWSAYDQSEGVYVYQIIVRDFFETKTFSGSITIVN